MYLVIKLLTVVFQRKGETNLKFMVCVTGLNELCSSQIKVVERLNPVQHYNYLFGEVETVKLRQMQL